jgi:hypothetical protein
MRCGCGLRLIAYNLGNLHGGGGAASTDRQLAMTSLRQRLVKTGGRLISTPATTGLLLAENHLTRPLFGSMMGRIAALPSPVA